ncbi:MAG TPA: RDD family protein [Campylobacter avium]|uniref:RDD family protein n=1 Tax=Campylobacter avium TaxID=522485 RepID=UPI001D365D25|nr:RDD family protein [Campylobacter avium]HJE66359.1 RDD family protein [Campylobacter avium]
MNNELLERLHREGLKLASFEKRIIAYLVDFFVISVILSFIFVDDLANTNYENAADLTRKMIITVFLVNFLYHFIFAFLYGASVGKFLCKIAIVDDRLLDKPNLLQSAIRAIMRNVSENCFMLGYFWAFGNDSRKTWQDYVAKTVVIEVA